MKGNFLLLDEPTNHLDMQSVEMLIEALNSYKGTLILVSHDRYFISRTANTIWSIEDGEIKDFKGDYNEWVTYQQEKQKRQQAEKAPAPVPEKKEEKKPEPKPQVNDQELRNLRKEYQKQQKTFEKLEQQINKMQEEKTSLEAKLADPAFYSDKNEFMKVDEAYRALTAKLETTTAEYDKVFEEMMALEEKLS